MKTIILKASVILAIWTIAFGVVYLASVIVGRQEVSGWGFCLTVGFTVAYGYKIASYVIRRFSKS